MYVLGINFSHHTSIALLDDNQVLLCILEERLNRQKYYRGPPLEALKLIPQYTKHIDSIQVYNGPRVGANAVLKALAELGVTVGNLEIVNDKHHLAHAASAFYMSPFDEACIIVVDGAGSMFTIKETPRIRASETTSMYRGSFPKIKCYEKQLVIGIYDKPPFILADGDKDEFKKRFPGVDVSLTESHDIGWRYAAVTSKIGFGVFGEGKTMGLSAYGRSAAPNTNEGQAYAIQKEIETYFVSLVNKSKATNVVLGGGCALNILANSCIKKEYPNINIYIDPIAADGTVALGAACHYFYTSTQSTDRLVFGPYQGPNQNIDKSYIYESARKY